MVYDMLMYHHPSFALLGTHSCLIQSYRLAPLDMYMMGMFQMVMCPQLQYQHYMIQRNYKHMNYSQRFYSYILYQLGTLILPCPPYQPDTLQLDAMVHRRKSL
jgi:hypothetical protein